MSEKKLEILKDLLVDEEHTLEDLRRLVSKSKPFLKIENNTGGIIISSEYPFITSEKAVIFLIGIYFSKEIGLNQDAQITSRVISESIDVKPTSLSGPLGELVRNKIVYKDGDSYSIKYYDIEKQLNILTERYLLKETTIQTTKKPRTRKRQKAKSPKTTKKVYLSSNASKEKIQREKLEGKETEKNLEEYELTVNNLYSIFNIDGSNIILLRGFKGANDRETHVKSTLLLLTANKLFFGSDELNSSLLRNYLKISGVPLKNISTTLKKYSTLIIHKRGPIGSTKTSYQITSLGFEKGIVLMKDIINTTSHFDISFKQKIRAEKAQPIQITNDKLIENIKSFSQDNDIDEEKLRSLFDFQIEGIRLLIKPKERVRKILQIKSLMLLGILLKRIYQVDNFNGKKLLKDSQIISDRLDLLDKNKFYYRYFSKKPKSAMELTYPGQNHALKMLKDYLKTEECNLKNGTD